MFLLLVYNRYMSLPSKELSDAALEALVAGERTRVVAPLTEWRTLAAQLSAEGLIRVPERSGPHGQRYSQPLYDELSDVRGTAPVRRGGIVRWGIRLVAGAALLGTGVVVGRGITIGEEVVPMVKQAIANGDSATMHGGSFRSAKEARTALVRAQSQYQRAAAYLAARDTMAQVAVGPEMYQERLAALDEMLATTQAKLQSVPGDPVLNQYYQSAVGAREATLQQLGRTLPASARLAHY